MKLEKIATFLVQKYDLDSQISSYSKSNGGDKLNG